MNVLIVTFNLKDLSEEDYRASCESGADAFAAIPGLIAKVWLADREANTYGGAAGRADSRLARCEAHLHRRHTRSGGAGSVSRRRTRQVEAFTRGGGSENGRRLIAAADLSTQQVGAVAKAAKIRERDRITRRIVE